MEDRSGPVRQLRLSGRTLRLAAGLGAVSGAVVLLLAVSLVLGSLTGFEARRLDGERAALLAELHEARDRVERLGGELERLVRDGGRLRRAAGLDPLHPEVLEVGVGGPGSGTPADHPLWASNRELAASAFAAEYDLGALERRSRLHRESLAEAADSLRAHRAVFAATPSILPTPGRVSSAFSRSRLHPVYNRSLPHTGVDISAPRGSPIVSTARGRIARVGWRAGYGLSVEIDHGNGFRTLYAHASETLVQRGQWVDRGELIARVGSTGTATAPHLHYEVLRDGRALNPMSHVLTAYVP